MQIKPHITLLYLLSVFTVLLCVSFLFYLVLPPDSDKITLPGNLSLRFPKPYDILGKDEGYADISNIIAQNQVMEDTVVAEQLVNDTTDTAIDTVRANADSLKGSIRLLEFPGHDHSILYPVFRAMDSAKARHKVVHIIHYGDSQIENDRITSFFRNRLQKIFGGCGVGLIPARDLYDFKYSVFHDASDNWFRYTLYGHVDTLIKHRRYGVLASFNSFTRQPFDTSTRPLKKVRAWISVKESPYSYKNTKSFEQCRLFYGFNKRPFTANLFVDNELADSGLYQPVNKLKQIHWDFNEPVKNMKLEFEGDESPEIYGIALDGKSGVAIDNVAMRGCAGLVFTKMDPEIFSDMMKMLDVKMVILQYGGNIVPNIRKDYSYYEKWFYSQLKYIRKYAPEVQIMVIGVSDMSIKKGGKYVSYPNIELVRDALKKATFKANAIYWDMYEAMGGKNSMPSWVFAKPSLAGSDFVHFNPKGARIIANMFYNAFIHEYKQYKRKSVKSSEQ